MCIVRLGDLPTAPWPVVSYKAFVDELACVLSKVRDGSYSTMDLAEAAAEFFARKATEQCQPRR